MRKLQVIALFISKKMHVVIFVLLGIEKDLGMTGSDYNIALTVFYLFVRHPLLHDFVKIEHPQQYVAVDIPSNLALKRFGSVWLAAMIICFGATSVGTAFVKSYTTFIVTRVFLGLTEGGTLV